MLQITQDILDHVNPMLDAGDTESAGKLLVDVDSTHLRALLIHILRDRGTVVADAVGEAYLHEHALRSRAREAA